MKKFDLLSIFLALFFSILIAGNLEAAIYYIDGSSGKDNNSGTIDQPWETISKANLILRAGDTVHIRAGTYDNQFIAPTNSGLAGNYITYKNYNEEEVIISGGVYSGLTYTQIYLNSVSYIKLDGIKFYYPKYQWGFITNCHHLKIENCVFDNFTNTKPTYHVIRIMNTDYVQFINTTFSADDVPWKNGDIGYDMVSVGAVSHFLFKKCSFGDAPHASFAVTPARGVNACEGNTVHEDGDYIVFKDCNITNKWRHGIITGVNEKRVLIDNCTFARVGRLNNECPWADDRNRVTPAIYSCGTKYSIYRRNIIYGSDTSIMIRSGLIGGVYSNYEHNWFYNNSVYDTDRCNDNDVLLKATKLAGCAIFGEALLGDYPIEDNKIINNIFWKIEGDASGSHLNIYGKGYPINNTIKHNIFGNPDGIIKAKWYQPSTTRTIAELEQQHIDWIPGAKTHYNFNPLFVDPDAAIPDFRLKQSSQAIDRGTWLTIITCATANNQTSITLDDATPFYSGAGAPWFIEGETGDVIKTQNGQLTTIQSIDYKTNTITVSPGINIVRGEGVALNYFGLAPDIGAYEYDSRLTLNTPKGLTIVE